MTEPQKGYKPALWKWSDIRPLLLDAGAHISLEESDRRVLILSNPGAPKPHHSTNTLYVSCSIYNPGELATVHRHTLCASRFVLEGDGGFTVVEGEKCTMSRGDLIVTPHGTWHDHGNEGHQPVMWVDVLDVPLVEALALPLSVSTTSNAAACVSIRASARLPTIRQGSMPWVDSGHRS